MALNLTVVGCGLTGSMLTDSLAAHMLSTEMWFDITLIDFDDVESRNSPGNHNVLMGLGEKKAVAMANKLTAYGLPAKAVTQRLTEKNAAVLLKNADLVIGAVDNIDARVRIWEIATGVQGIPYMDIGLHNFGFNVSWTYGGVDTMQYSPAASIKKVQKMPDEEKLPACELISTRLNAAAAVECAARSAMIFSYGHDPAWIVQTLTGNKVEAKDMVGWSGVFAVSNNDFMPLYLGRGEV